MHRFGAPCTSRSSSGTGFRSPEYGGTQRMVVSLARGLAAAGHRVTLVAGHGSVVPEATLVPVSLDEARRPGLRHPAAAAAEPGHRARLRAAPHAARRAVDPPSRRQLEAGDDRRAQHALPQPRTTPERHGGGAFVYNGVDPAEYRFRRDKDDYDLFLGRLHGVKGYRWAVAGAKRLRRRMLIAGGWRPSLSRYVRYVGQSGRRRGRRSCWRARGRSGCRRSGTSRSASR